MSARQNFAGLSWQDDAPERGLQIGCDLVSCAFEDFEEGKGLATSFVSETLKNGREVYKANIQ